MNAKRREGRLAKRRAEIINQACKTAFSAGFERYKIMAQVHFSADSVKLLLVNFLDESLKTVTADRAEKFARTSCYSAEANKVNAAVQTEKVTDVEKSCSEASHSNDTLGQ